MGDDAMDPNASLQLWNNNDRGGGSSKYKDVQGQDNILGNTDCLETAANTWVIVFSETNYDGDMLQAGPSTYLHDLKKTDRFDPNGKKVGNWKNQIKSFVLYKHQPDFWGYNPTTPDLYKPPSNGAVFTENANFLGANRTFTAPISPVDLDHIDYTTNGNAMFDILAFGGTINSLRVGDQAWLVIFDALDCQGATAKLGPKKSYSDLNSLDRVDVNGNRLGDWNNQIAGFLLYPSQPAFWETAYSRPYIDFNTLFNLYPSTTNSASDGKIIYVIEDATYQIDNPDLIAQCASQTLENSTLAQDTTNLPSDGWTEYYVQLDHKNTAGRNDKAYFYAYFDNAGNLVSIQYFNWTSDSGAYTISDEFINIVDKEAWFLGEIGAFETFGISDEAADTFIEIFDFVCKVFNDITSLVYNKTDDGGRYYFLPVICHTINRLCTVVQQPYEVTTYDSSDDSRNGCNLSFSYTDYSNALQTSGYALSSIDDWATKSGSAGTAPFNEVIEYEYQNYSFRTWYQEVSFSTQLGMFVSCKIDYEIDSNKDDHIILLVGFTVPPEGQTKGILSFAQATIQFTDNSSANITSQPRTGDDIVSNVQNDLAAGLASITTDSSTGGRTYLADIAAANLHAMEDCAAFN